MTVNTHTCRAAALSLTLLLAGCGDPQITHYTVPKERPAQANPTVAHSDRPQPVVEWKLPAGWSQIEARVGLASFAVFGDGGKQAQINITPLPSMNGREALIINMWRSQVGLAEIPEAEAMGQLTPVEVGGEAGKMFEVASPAAGAEGPQRIVTAMVHRPDASWFYKISGDDAVVQAEKPRFVEFLKSIQIKASSGDAPPFAPAPGAPMAPPPAPAGKFNWTVPAGWQAVAPGQMQAAKFSVPSTGAAKADVMVSIFPSDTGGLLGNVTRWRGQIGLSEISEADLAKLITPLDPKDSRAVLVDMTNNGKQLIGAIVPRGGQWFFYKLLGDEAAVAAQRDAFIAFVRSEP